MARITVEDCLDKVENRFQLVIIATERARQIALGAKPLVEVNNDKPTVLALREIAEGKIDASILDDPVPAVAEESLDADATPIPEEPGQERAQER